MRYGRYVTTLNKTEIKYLNTVLFMYIFSR